jgi:cytochrome c peroxidase
MTTSAGENGTVADANCAGRGAASIDRAAVDTDFSAFGRFLIPKKKADIAAFKTPDTRNILVTGPYLHDGSHETLWDVTDHYNKTRISTKTFSPSP